MSINYPIIRKNNPISMHTIKVSECLSRDDFFEFIDANGQTQNFRFKDLQMN
jgi:hypothetical protein